MKPCPNCGQDTDQASDRFCPHCGYLLPWAQPNAPRGQQAPVGPAGAGAPRQAYAPQPHVYAPRPHAPQPQPQQSAGTRPALPYAEPTPPPSGYAPGGYSGGYAPGGVDGGNLPLPRVQRAPTPVAPGTGSDPLMNVVGGLIRSLGGLNPRTLLVVAAVILVLIFAFGAIIHTVALVVQLVPWLILAALVFYVWQRWGRSGRRLP